MSSKHTISNFCLSAVAGLLLCGAASLAGADPVATSPAVVAYVFARNGVLPPGEIDVNKLTRINYAFANIQAGRMVPGSPTDGNNFAVLLALKRKNPALTVLVSVGGWLWSDKFSDMALTRESRKLFIESAVDVPRPLPTRRPGHRLGISRHDRALGIRSVPKTNRTTPCCSKSYASDSTTKRSASITGFSHYRNRSVEPVPRPHRNGPGAEVLWTPSI